MTRQTLPLIQSRPAPNSRMARAPISSDPYTAAIRAVAALAAEGAIPKAWPSAGAIQLKADHPD